MRKLATIQIIREIRPIENADAIEVARVRGWDVVVKKGEFKPGDFCIYFEIDSFLPIREEYEFLRKSSHKTLHTGQEGFRLRTMKLRGQISQGLVLPLPEGIEPEENKDLTEFLEIELYEPYIPCSMDIKGPFPGFIYKTDEERIQNLVDRLPEFQQKFWWLTEKIDGQSITCYIRDGVFGVCSRNFELKETDAPIWKIIRHHKIEEKMREQNRNFAFQGEFHGAGVQGNPYKMKHHDIRFFSQYDMDKGSYCSYEEFINLCGKLKITIVPILVKPIRIGTLEEILTLANGKSEINPDVNREGIVFVSNDIDRLSFKVISNKYLLKGT